MLSYLPAPKPDECLYSIIARLCYHILNDSPKSINRFLFGTESAKAIIDLPGYLNHFHQKAKSIFPYSIDEIIQNFTLYLFYFNFMKESSRKIVYESMLSSDASGIHTRVGINASTLRRSRFPYYCPLCVIDDHKEFGETFFRRLHQIPDMVLCTKHKCYLIQIQPSPEQLNKSLFLSPTYATNKSVHYVENKLLIDVATAFELIHNHQLEFDTNKLDYKKSKCIERYFKSTSLNRQSIVDDFTKYFGSENLKVVLNEQRDNLSWVPDIIHRPTHVFHPLKHILVKLFIDSVPTLFSPRLVHPFGLGPWKCINKASSHFMEDVITDMTYHTDPKSNRVIGVFTCSCGMIYTKSFIKRKNDTKEFIRIKEWGDLWKEKLQVESKSGKGLRELSRILGTDPQVIKKFISTNVKSTDKNSKQLPSDELKIKWVELLNKFNENRVLNARNEAPEIYAWLYRNEYQWLMDTNSEYKSKTIQRKLRVNWEKLDSQIAFELEQAFNSLMRSDFQHQITRTILAKLINREQYLLDKSICQLPKAKLFLKNYLESLEEYQKRRVKNVMQKLASEGESLSEWKIMRKAGLKKTAAKSIFDLISDSISKEVA